MICKFCGREVHAERYLSAKDNDVYCGQCASHCVKKCELGKSAKVQGWHFEPCLSCGQNPYNKKEQIWILKH